MSNVPLARKFLEEALSHSMDPAARRLCRTALRLMTRDPAIRRVPGIRQVIDDDMRFKIRALAASGLTMQQIANKVGLRNGGRVSEVLNGKR